MWSRRYAWRFYVGRWSRSRCFDVLLRLWGRGGVLLKMLLWHNRLRPGLLFYARLLRLLRLYARLLWSALRLRRDHRSALLELLRVTLSLVGATLRLRAVALLQSAVIVLLRRLVTLRLHSSAWLHGLVVLL